MSPSAGARILVVDDEPAIRRAVRTNLHAHGFDVETAETAAEALERFEHLRPDLIVLDLNLPEPTGLDVIRHVRERGSTPIIVLSVRDAERDKVAALDLGADDYVTKPFGADELLARIRVALRHLARPPRGADSVFRTGDLRVDLERREVTSGGRPVRLTPTEYELLKAFIAHPDRVLTDRMLLQQVWGADYGDESHYLHVYVARLRKKVEDDPQRPRYLITEPGVGYRLLLADE
ncbi:MAG: response regulator transcription factor [Chloroflexi bacterium]|nr:MAG: response regulator transcription factor [Chloroflexota bacterium]